MARSHPAARLEALAARAVVVVALVVAACATGASRSPAHLDIRSSTRSVSDTSFVGEVPFTPLHRSGVSGYVEPIELVVRSREEWRRAWTGAFPNLSAGPPSPPDVDFTREIVVVVASGQRPSGGYGIRIDGIVRDASGGVLVRYTTFSPGAGCLSTQQITSPVDIVRMPRVTSPVRFVARRVEHPC